MDARADDFKTFIDQNSTKIKETLKKKEQLGQQKYLTDILESWKSTQLNIGLIGKTGAGKSTIINTLLKIKSDDSGAAKVSVVPTTSMPTSYMHPENPHLLFWDLPGFGTKEFPKEHYLNKIGFKKFDFFLVLSQDRFTEDDEWLARALRREKMTFYFIRTHVDTYVYSLNKGRNEAIPEEELLRQIRKDYQQNLEEGEYENIFLLDCHELESYDFNNFLSKLIKDAPDLKRESIILSFSVLTRSVIDEKKKVLQERIFPIALCSGSAGAVPIPGIGIAVDCSLLATEVLFYKKQFGLDEESLEILSRRINIQVDSLKEALQLKSTIMALTAKGTIVFCRESIKTASAAVPVIGSAISFGVSYWCAKKCLEHVLNTIYDDAIRINDYIMNYVKSYTSV